MHGWQEVLELQALAASAAAGVLGGEGIKALHINTIMKEKKKKVKQCNEEMENGIWPFCPPPPPSPKAMPPSLISLVFWMQLVILSLPLPLSRPSAPSLHALQVCRKQPLAARQTICPFYLHSFVSQRVHLCQLPALYSSRFKDEVTSLY